MAPYIIKGITVGISMLNRWSSDTLLCKLVNDW